jgi:hypothetical protein
MHGERRERIWVVHGFHFIILERKHWLPSGPISLFSCESLDGLSHDDLSELSVESTIDVIEEKLPEWIERTRANGRETMSHDPEKGIKELGPPGTTAV